MQGVGQGGLKDQAVTVCWRQWVGAGRGIPGAGGKEALRKLQPTRIVDEMLVDVVGGCGVRDAGAETSFARAAVLILVL